MLANFRKCPNPVTIAIEVDCNVHNIVIFLLDLVKDLVLSYTVGCISYVDILNTSD